MPKKSTGYQGGTYRRRGTTKNSGKTKRRRRRQTEGFLSRYDFAYADRDMVNQVGKIAPGIINKATADIDKIAKQRISQVIRDGGAEIERSHPKSSEEQSKKCTRHLFDCWETWVKNNS